MTDLASHVAPTLASLEVRANHSAVSGYLKLRGLEPYDVWVDIFPCGDDQSPKAGFAHTENGHYHTDGIEWECPLGTEYAMFVTFKFSSLVGSVDCPELLYSETFGGDGHKPVKQKMCFPPAEEQTEYHFNVYPAGLRGGTKPEPIDPKIIISPVIPAPDPSA